MTRRRIRRHDTEGATAGGDAPGQPVLTREGDLLVGDALRRPLPIAGTTYEIATDYEGSWVVVLRHGGETLRLAPGGWRIDGERRATRDGVARALEQLGLSAR